MNLFTIEWRIRSIPNKRNHIHYIIEVRRPIYYFWRVPRFTYLRGHSANEGEFLSDEWPSFKYATALQCKQIIETISKEYLKKKHFKKIKPKVLGQGTFLDTGFIENI